MLDAEKRRWAIVAVLFLTLLFVFGPVYDAFPVFLLPLVHDFRWSRAQVSWFPALLAILGGGAAPVAGWLLDRIEARGVIITGAVICGCGFLIAASAHSFAVMLCAYVALGLGLGFATLVPAAFVVSNWFDERRGVALGITMAGTTAGGMLTSMGAGALIAAYGWRFAYAALSIPIFVVVVPIVALIVRSRPPTARARSIKEGAEELSGFEVGEALRRRGFWMVALASFCWAMAVAGTNAHLVAHLVRLHHKTSVATLAFSLMFGMGSGGKLLMGWLADRIGGRKALCLDLLLGAAGIGLLAIATSPAILWSFVLIYGISVGAPLSLLPLMLADAVGLRRFGALSGLGGIFNTLGATLGPLVAGKIFDATSSYVGALALFVLLMIAAGGAALLGEVVEFATVDRLVAEQG